jgi:hypothetical protein
MTSVGNLKKAVCGFFREVFFREVFCRAGLGTGFFNRCGSSFKTRPTSAGEYR